MDKQVDILIIGAGISGIGVAAHLSQNCPQRSFEIIERRQSFGGVSKSMLTLNEAIIDVKKG